MKVFTVRNGEVTQGAKIEKLALKGAGVEIDAVIVGESGRGRERGVLPVHNAPVDGVLRFAAVGKARSGKTSLVAEGYVGDTEHCIAVFRTVGGYRGGAEHGADDLSEKVYGVFNTWLPEPNRYVVQGSRREVEAYCAKNDIGSAEIFEVRQQFPGEIICQGFIAQGAAGRMGSNAQIVAVLPRDVWCKIAYGGRLYGGPSAHYCCFDGKRLFAVTLEVRQLLKVEAATTPGVMLGKGEG